MPWKGRNGSQWYRSANLPNGTMDASLDTGGMDRSELRKHDEVL